MNKDVLFIKNFSTNKNFNGYTLIELCICIAIIALATILSAPSFSKLIEKHKIDTQVSELYRLLVFARTESVLLNSPVSLCSSLNNKSCYTGKNWSNRNLLVYVDKNFNNEIDENERVLKIYQPKEKDSRIIWRSFGNKSFLTFMPTGITNYQPGNITYCPQSLDEKKAKILVINMAGRPYYGRDNNGDNIDENGSGKNLSCSI